MSDRVTPTRNARNGTLLPKEGTINIKNEKWKTIFAHRSCRTAPLVLLWIQLCALHLANFITFGRNISATDSCYCITRTSICGWGEAGT